MKKNQTIFSKPKKLMVLSVMSALTKKYDKVNEACVFAINKEKVGMAKSEGLIASSMASKFINGINADKNEYQIIGNELTILNFCLKSCDLMIAKTHGNDKIKGLEIVKERIIEQLETIDKNQTDDSQLLVKKLE